MTPLLGSEVDPTSAHTMPNFTHFFIQVQSPLARIILADGGSLAPALRSRLTLLPNAPA